MTTSPASFTSEETKQASTATNALVVRRNELVHARYRMTLQEQRLLLWLISQIGKGDTAFETYRVSVKELASVLGLENNKDMYARVAHYTEQLMTRVAKVHRIGENTLTQVQFLSKTKYYFGDGMVELCLNEHMRPYLIELKEKFTAIELGEAIRLTSFYAVRIYEILMSEAYKGQHYEIELQALRDRLGIEEGKLKRVEHLRTKVLDIAEREINGGTRLRFSSEWIKTGKSVTGVRFVFQKRIEGSAAAPASGLDQLLIGAGLSVKDAQAFVVEFGASDPDRIRWHVSELKRQQAKGKVANPIGWLKHAIRTDYRASAHASAEAKRREADDRKREAALRAGAGGARSGQTESLKDVIARRAHN